MAFKPNYNQQRSDRNRLKEQKKRERLQQRETAAAKRKADLPVEADGDDAAASKVPQ